MSFEWLNSLQLSEYVIFIWFDLFSLCINIWGIISCSGDTKLFNGISGKVPLLQYGIQLPWYQCLVCLFWQCTFHQHWPNPLNLGCIHISPTLLWCLIAGIKCSGAFGKLANNMGGPSPPPPSQNQASGFLPPIYKGTLFCPSWVSNILYQVFWMPQDTLLLFLPNSLLISSF